MNELELFAAEVYDEGGVTEVIRPSAIVPEVSARAILIALADNDVRGGGLWDAEPAVWRRYDRPFSDTGEPAGAELLGTIQVAYGTPTRYEITIYRATVSNAGAAAGWTVQRLCDEALGFGGLSLDSCPRADLVPPPQPVRFS